MAQLSENELYDISEKSGVDVDVLRSWYKGTTIIICIKLKGIDKMF
jgi:hypothetical protein